MIYNKVIELSLVCGLMIGLSGCGSSDSTVDVTPSATPTVNPTANPTTVPTSTPTPSSSRDTTAPKITIKGKNPVRVVENRIYKDLGATAFDDVDGKVEVKSYGIINTAKIGTYKIVYKAVDKSGNEANATRVVEVVAEETTSYTPPTPIKNYYITPVNLTPTDKIGQAKEGVDFISGQALFKSLEAKSATSKLQFSKVYKSFDDINKSMGTFSTEFDSYVDAELPIRIKSSNYLSAKEACEKGWNDIDSKAFRGLLQNTRAIYNEKNTLCDIYDKNEIVASLLTRHKVDGISKKLHTLTEPNGTAHVFYEEDGKWMSNTKSPIDFRETSTGFLVSKTNDKAEYVTYDKKGKLSTVVINGQVVSLEYDSKDRLISLTDPYKKRIKLYYNEKNFISTIESPDETNSTYVYNEKGQLISSIASDGTSTKFTYTDSGDLSGVVNVLGLTVKTYSYDTEGKTIKTAELGGKNTINIQYDVGETVVKKTTGEVKYKYKVINSLLKPTSIKTDEGTTVVSYDSHGYPKEVVDNRGIITKTTYNEAGLLVSKVTNAQTSDEQTILKSYGKEFRKATKIVAEGVVTFREYDTDGKIVKKIVGSVSGKQQKLSRQDLSRFSKTMLKSSTGLDTAITSYKYDKYGKRLETTKPNGAVVKGEYDANGNSNKRTDALGFSSETLEFDKAGRPIKTKDKNGVISTMTYNSAGKLVASTTQGQTTTYEYDVTGFNTKVVYPTGLVVTNSYDLANKTETTQNNRGEKTVNYYDLEKNLLKTEIFKDDILVSKSESKYDSKNRVIETIDALGNKTSFKYNDKGEKVSTTDAMGRETKFVYNKKGQLTQEINPDGKVTTYEYNSHGQKSKVITPNGAEFGFEYDALGRVVKKTNPDRGTTEYTYDVSGNILTETDAKGNRKSYTYDIANRKTSISYSADASLNESYEYDQGENAKGKLTKITDSSGSISFEYDIEGHVITKIQEIDSKTFTTHYSYDEQGKLTSVTYPSGKIVSYSFNGQGDVISLSIDGTLYISDIKNNQNGLLSYTYADGSKHSRVYDANGRLERLIYPNYTEEVGYNVVNNITNISNNDNNQTFNYDVLNRLINYRNLTDGEYQNFGYDGNGNRLTQNQEVNRTRGFSYMVNSNLLQNIKYYHRVDENRTEITKDINYTYDKMGNIIKDDKHTYNYDGRNRLTTIDSNVTYQYNNNNRRVSKTVNGIITYFIYEGHKLMGEYDKDGNVIKEYFYLGNTPIAMRDSTETYNIYSDHLNTPRRVTNSKNKTVWKWESTPFGETAPTGSLEFNLRFAGQYFDNETGTHYNINRDYNPVTGRYIQSDPIGLDGGFSTFVYVNGNPVMLVDLEGLFGGTAEASEPRAEEEKSYEELVKQIWRDIKYCNKVPSDIRNLIGTIVRIVYSDSFYHNGHYVRGITAKYHEGITSSQNTATIYIMRTVFEEKPFNYTTKKNRLVFTTFHELQHNRRTNYGPRNTHPESFNKEYRRQANNFHGCNGW